MQTIHHHSLRCWRASSVLCCVIGAWLVVTSAAVFANETPLWEVRLGLGAAQVPYYRGSTQTHRYFLPIPYAIYRGEHLRVSDDGIKNLFIDRDDIKVDISLAAGLPARSDEQSPRAGMPGLDPTLEFGPSLKLRLAHDEASHTALWLNMPVRVMTSFDDVEPHGHGSVFAPYLQYIKPLSQVRLSFSGGPIIASNAYHGYYYDVDEQYATADRPAYRAGAGYSGTRLSASLSRRDKTTWWRIFARYDLLDGATFTDSPLLQQQRYAVIGIAATWQLYASRASARKADDPLEVNGNR